MDVYALLLHYSKNKWTIFSTLSLKKGSNRNTSKYFIDYPDELWEGKSTLKGETENILGTIGVDYQLSKMVSVGVLYSGNYYENEAKDQRYVSLYSVNDKSFGSIKTEGKTTRNNKQNNLNFHYSQKLDTLGRNMSIDLNYFDYLDNRDRVFSSNRMGVLNIYQASNNTGDQKVRNHSAKADFTYPTPWAELSFGGKITRTKTDNSLNFFDLTNGNSIFDKTKSNTFEYTENIQALYLEATRSFNEKWQAKLGLRVENTQIKGYSKELKSTHTNRYFEYFPTVYLNYDKNQNSTFNLSYSRRINRPSFHFLNPFKFYTDANSYTVGNPDLKFSISDIAGLKYIYKSNLITELFFERNKDSFSQVIDLDIKNNTQVYIYKNVGDTYFYGVGQTVIYHPFEWWDTTTMLSAFYFDIKINEAIKLAEFGVNKGWVSVLYTNQVFFLSKNKNLQAEIGFLARTRSYNDLETFDPTYTLDIGFRASLLNKSLQVTAKINDIFNTSLYKSTSYTKGIKQRYINDYDNRYFTLGLSYKFGNNKIAVKEHDKGNEDELNRIK